MVNNGHRPADRPSADAPATAPGRISLDLVGQEGTGRKERADATRNRVKVLEAAERLFATVDPRSVTMEDIASAAGVGRATLYRRYPSPSSVAVALLDEHERQLQHELIRGAPPLGPGAAPAERLAAFYESMINLLDQHLQLALGAESGASRLATGAYRFWRLHVLELLRQAGIEGAESLVDSLLAPLSPEVYRYQRDERGQTREQITDALQLLARRLLPRPRG
ncbi:TetR/AcrR family transcriptional regulator [Amycolatopsis nigrescens]|uniref:TetR/AcrR family transcriptional regulator n=1 Tax=Amycolatopsis nigrescens TaxID=381445 RepID=UPI00036AC0CE|nr:TetR/AcrR family transcriptional regulator [Amycolatopsis nigrescens]